MLFCRKIFCLHCFSFFNLPWIFYVNNKYSFGIWVLSLVWNKKECTYGKITLWIIFRLKRPKNCNIILSYVIHASLIWANTLLVEVGYCGCLQNKLGSNSLRTVTHHCLSKALFYKEPKSRTSLQLLRTHYHAKTFCKIYYYQIGREGGIKAGT